MRKTLTLLAATTALAASVVGSTGTASATPAPSGPGPFYWLINANSGKAVMPAGESAAVGQTMVQHTKGNLGAEHWRILGSGTVRILYNRNSHLCLLAPSNGSGWIAQQQCNDPLGDPYGNRPKWRASNYDAMWAGTPVTWKSEYSGDCLDVYGASVGDLAPVIQYPCHGGPNQQFRLEYVPGT